MNINMKAYKYLLAISISLLLAACGQQGPLYQPGTQSPYGPPEYSPLHPDETSSTPKTKKAKTTPPPQSQPTASPQAKSDA